MGMLHYLNNPIQMTPEQFEIAVKEELLKLGIGLKSFTVERLETLKGSAGSFRIDVSARFEALGADFLVLIECKHHKHPIKREVVQILHNKISELSAQKGMIFSTSRFQRGAIAYAKKRGIALVWVADGRTAYQTKSIEKPVTLPDWMSQVAFWIMGGVSDANVETYELLDNSSLMVAFGSTAYDKRRI